MFQNYFGHIIDNREMLSLNRFNEKGRGGPRLLPGFLAKSV